MSKVGASSFVAGLVFVILVFPLLAVTLSILYIFLKMLGALV